MDFSQDLIVEPMFNIALDSVAESIQHRAVCMSLHEQKLSTIVIACLPTMQPKFQRQMMPEFEGHPSELDFMAEPSVIAFIAQLMVTDSGPAYTHYRYGQQGTFRCQLY